MHTRPISKYAAYVIGDTLGVNWSSISLDEFKRGLEIELAATTSSFDEHIALRLTGLIAYGHLRDQPDYYSRLVARRA